MATVLITQCLQRDFVDPIGPHDPLPNLLHVGHREATRLLGPEPSAGPLAQLIDWAHGLAPDAIDLVHIRDWHDPGDPAQREHLQRFGAHCIKGSHGARLVLGMDERAGAASNEVIVDSRSPRLVRAWEVLQVLRRIGGQLCHEDRHPLQLQVALLRYAVHTLSFPEPSPLQKQSALAAACSLAEQITRTVEAELADPAGRSD